MVVGDTGVLLRLERASRQADRAQSRIHRKLIKRAIAKGRPAAEKRLGSLVKHSYFSRDPIQPNDHVRRFRRRIGRVRGADGHRLFYVSEIGGDLEHGGTGVVVAPRQENAQPDQAIDAAQTGDGCWCRDGISLFTTAESLHGLVFSARDGDKLVQARVYQPREGAPIFALTQGLFSTAPPSAFGLDRHLAAGLQREAMRVLGFCEQ